MGGISSGITEFLAQLGAYLAQRDHLDLSSDRMLFSSSIVHSSASSSQVGLILAATLNSGIRLKSGLV